jgi:PKD repeat protein
VILNHAQISAGMEQQTCIGAGLEGVGSGKACITASIDATHGGKFEKSTDKIQEISFRRKVIAANDDKVVFFGTPYGVWEYPVLSGAEDKPSGNEFITVAFPLISVTQYPDTSGGYYSGTCDEAWYSANHQPNNVWSYDPIGDIRFEDYQPGTDPTYDAIEGDWAEGEITGANLKRDFGSVTFAHSVSAKLQYESEAEASLGIVNVSSNFKAYIQGDYGYERMKTDTLEAGEETTFSYFFAPQPDSAKFTTRVLFYKAKDNYQVIDYQAEPGRTTAWQLYDKPDPAFILPWYGFPEPNNPQAPPCGADKKLFSPSVVIDPPAARRGDTVTVTAVVRNFSNERAQNVRVRFYRGDPANNIVIGNKLIPSLARETGPEQVTITWVAEGVGQQKIFAVIDPDQVIPEVHDEADDYINNNVAYGLLQLSASADADMGQAAEQPYDLISYDLADPGPTISFYVPRASLDAVARFEVKAAADIGLPAGGQAFEVVAYQGSKFKLWNEPIADFNLRPEAGDPPAVIGIAYHQAELAALAESDLNLYRLDGAFWREAVCPGYRIERFLADDLIAVPVCQTGLFAFSDHTPEPLLPLAMFTAIPTSGPAPLEVVFSDMSTGYPTGWHWDFGDGNTSGEQNPTHTYQGGGLYDVILTVSNEAGSDTHAESGYISVTGLNADFTASPNRGEAPLTVNFTNQSSGYPYPPSSWEWDFGDGNSSTERDPTYIYTQNGAYTVTLTVRYEDDFATKVDQNCVIVADILPIYLPLILKSAGPPGPGGPDLVVKELTASSNAVTLVIKNQGDAWTADDEDFWVDVYVDPREPPSLNKIWQAIAEQGLAWGVTDPIGPGGELTLTIGGAYYVPGESEFSGMAPGTPVWAQVDAVNYQTSYGSVLEKNEGNNVFGPVSAVASQAGVVVPPSVEDGEPVPTDEGLPGRR